MQILIRKTVDKVEKDEKANFMFVCKWKKPENENVKYNSLRFWYGTSCSFFSLLFYMIFSTGQGS